MIFYRQFNKRKVLQFVFYIGFEDVFMYLFFLVSRIAFCYDYEEICFEEAL